MGLTRAILIGTLYTIVGFTVSFLFLHLASMYWFHQTGFEFLSDIDSQRSIVQQQAAATNPGSLQDIFLRDKVYYFIITLVIGSIWILNINHTYNKE